ncbi:unnamed protein product [Camellia sinensis]
MEAQANVCTGPTQTRPLTEEQAFKVLDTILRSGWQCVFVYPFSRISNSVNSVWI